MRYLVEFTLPDEDGELREEVSDTSESGAALPDDDIGPQAEDTEGTVCVWKCVCCEETDIVF